MDSRKAVTYRSSDSSEIDDDIQLLNNLRLTDGSRKVQKYDQTPTKVDLGYHGVVPKQYHNPRTCKNEVNMTRANDDCKIHNVKDEKGPSIQVNYLSPNKKSDKFDPQKNQIGIVEYSRDGKQPRPDGGAEFYMRDADKIKDNNDRRTMHDRAFKSVHNKYPEDVGKVVATGFANKPEKGGLQFRSDTFNKGPPKKYLYSDYYNKNDTREASEPEKSVIKETLDAWEKRGCDMNFKHSLKNNNKKGRKN